MAVETMARDGRWTIQQRVPADGGWQSTLVGVFYTSREAAQASVDRLHPTLRERFRVACLYGGVSDV